jgi:hypothetical protein
MLRSLSSFLFLLLLLPCAACVPVAAYERGSLAHPTMTTADIVLLSEEHVRAVQEGAIGGSGAAGGGCGCN